MVAISISPIGDGSGFTFSSANRKFILTGFVEGHDSGIICIQDGLIFQILTDAVNEDDKQEGPSMEP